MNMTFTISKILLVLSLLSSCRGKANAENGVEKKDSGFFTTEREKNCNSGGQFKKTEEAKSCFLPYLLCTKPILKQLPEEDKNGTLCTKEQCDVFYAEESSDLRNEIYKICKEESASADCSNVFVDKANLHKSGNQIIAECKQKFEEECRVSLDLEVKKKFYDECQSRNCEKRQEFKQLFDNSNYNYNKNESPTVRCDDQTIIDEAFANLKMPYASSFSENAHVIGDYSKLIGCLYNIALKNHDAPLFYGPYCPEDFKVIDTLHSYVTHYCGKGCKYTLCKTQTICGK